MTARQLEEDRKKTAALRKQLADMEQLAKAHLGVTDIQYDESKFIKFGKSAQDSSRAQIKELLQRGEQLQNAVCSSLNTQADAQALQQDVTAQGPSQLKESPRPICSSKSSECISKATKATLPRTSSATAQNKQQRMSVAARPNVGVQNRVHAPPKKPQQVLPQISGSELTGLSVKQISPKK